MPHNKPILSKRPNAPLLLFGLVVLFWTTYDSIMQYITPLLMEERGFSATTIGLILGFSSIAGALFDFIIAKIFHRMDVRRIFLVMFAICAIYPFILFGARHVWTFLFAMAVWGVYFDLYGFGVFNFVGRYAPKHLHASESGVIQMFRALGGVLAPLVVGAFIIERVTLSAFAVGGFFLFVAAILFGVLLIRLRKYTPKEPSPKKNPSRPLFKELILWRHLGAKIAPALSVTFFLFFVEAFFWTLAPLYAETANLGPFGGLFLTMYVLPGLLVGWFVSGITRRFGKKRTAIVSALLGSLLLSTFAWFDNPIAIMAVIFIASCAISMALPAINAAYADYISEATALESEIEGLGDFGFNIGYVLGPIAAGVFADWLSIPAAFSLLGFIGVVLMLFLLAVTPKHIHVTSR